MDNRKLASALGLAGCLVCSSGLFLTDYVFAGIISNWWYIINAIFWICVIKSGRKRGVIKKIISVELLLFIGIVLVYIKYIPIYSYEEAVSIVRSEQPSINYQKVEAPWKYRGYTDGDVYLIVFEADEPAAFWFDPYCGNYGIYNIEDRLPFLLDED